MIARERLSLESHVKLVTVGSRTLALTLELEREDGPFTLFAMASDDCGASFGKKEVLTELPPTGKYLGLEAAADENGLLHLFVLNDANTRDELMAGRGEGERPSPEELSRLRINVWHCAYDYPGKRMITPPRAVWQGYCGSLNSCIITSRGRVLLPISYKNGRTWRERGDAPSRFSFFGSFSSAVLYSDDGVSFSLSNPLDVPVPDIVSSYGAVEPVCLELAPDRQWMLLRTQLGVFFESYSEDGSLWSKPAPTKFVSSDSPAGLVRTKGGEIVLFLNACRSFPYAHGGRHVLHGAVSRDNGRSFQGFVEVAADPMNDQPPPPWGDHGTAYPYPYASPDGSVVFSTGQGKGRVQNLRLNPTDLFEQTRACPLGEAHIFGCGLSRREDGILLPAGGGTCVLNLSSRMKGSVRLRISGRDAWGARLLLTDAFSVPFDPMDELTCCAAVPLTVTEGKGTVSLDFDFTGDLPGEKPGGWAYRRFPWQGISYLRIKAPVSGELLLKEVSVL